MLYVFINSIYLYISGIIKISYNFYINNIIFYTNMDL